jgi:hypothetical protein
MDEGVVGYILSTKLPFCSSFVLCLGGIIVVASCSW